MFSEKHISFLLIALMLISLLVGCKKTDGNLSSSVISNGHETVDSSNSTNTSSVDSEVSEPDTSSSENSEGISSSKPGNGNNSNSTSSTSKPASSSASTASSKPTSPSNSTSSANTQSSATTSNSSQTTTSPNTATDSKPADPTTSTSSPATHLHTYKKITVEPTCTEDGKTYFECVECGAIKDEIVIIKSTGHTWGEWKTTAEATLLSEGAKERECSVCHEKETEQIPMLEPDYSALRTELLNLVNNERTNKLEYNTEKQTEADKRAEELAESFVSKNGEGYTENIYKGSLSENGEFTAQEAFDYWFNSENQKDKNNILSEEFTHTAIGVVLKDGEYYWVQIFSK